MQPRYGGAATSNDERRSERYANVALAGAGASAVGGLVAARGQDRVRQAVGRQEAAARARRNASRAYNVNNAKLGRLALMRTSNDRWKGWDNRFDGGAAARRQEKMRQNAANRIRVAEGAQESARAAGRRATKMRRAGLAGAGAGALIAVGGAVAAERPRRNNAPEPEFVRRVRAARSRRDGGR